MQLSRRALAMVLLIFVSFPAMAVWPFEDSSGRELPSLAPMLEDVNPAVVNISTFAARQETNPLMNDPFFRHFFGPNQYQQPQARRSQSAGSGVIVDAKKGTVITNFHVIDGADEIKVGLNDGRSYVATLVGSDPDVDIAILQIEADDIKAIKIADSEEARVGDFVVAIGNPFGLGQTVTTGVVSAIGRTGLGIEGYENFIQTDASINPGNSGGALVNLNGELVGINTAIIAPSGGNVGIGFAIPANMAKHSLEQILEHGEVKRGQLGVVIQDLTPDLAEAFDLKGVSGVVVSEVQEGSAAEKAGIEQGDVLTKLDGKTLKSSAQLRNAVGVRKVGAPVELTLIRDGKEKVIKAKIGEPSGEQIASTGIRKYLDGARLAPSRDPKGVLVESLEPGSTAQIAGLRVGDIITSVNKARVESLNDLKKATQKDGSQLLIRVLRGNAALYLVLR
ncbi:DegQ family serine endoprotease [Ketobacter sp. MCCC 1A13808]|uniref:DegQ family serine endoprotease n=1 Tax=Ketobacter sp. MCCC 1A13808 TaxID=2602738 RepID=UPI000F1E397C|nr:DegQ family serine endoprotease [Ketobacter sp. MCCC 1A13808]MVF12862.1 DegQ family serine endoprotease [Ketobacter sp. MCCC 1A13808]RLP54464.1 MAG: DegQ family serine endoprotease [Ketobacter sp.]